MARVTIEDCLAKVDSRFSLVHLAVRRVLQQRSGAPLLVQAPKNKEVVLALREVAAGKVSMANIRELEEQKALPDVAAQLKSQPVNPEELKELLDTETKLGVALEYGSQSEVEDTGDLDQPE